MGLFSSISDTLFGGTDDSSQKKQIQANERSQAFIEEQAALARGDALSLQGLGDQARNTGYRSAIEMLQGSTPQQIDLTARGNLAGQEALLAGLPQIQNAILGMPVDMGAFQSTDLRSPGMLDWMQGATIPQAPTDYTSMLGGGFDPSGMSNQEIVARALQSGLISQADYDQFQQTFANSGNAAGQYWGKAGSASPLINNIRSDTSPSWRATLENLYTGIYPRGAS